MSRYFIHIEHGEHNKCLNWEMLHFYPLKELILNLMPATGLKVGKGLQWAEKARYFQMIKLTDIRSITWLAIKGMFRRGRRSLFDARGHLALRRHCITHRHDSVIHFTKWAQEYFQKPLSVNTICCAICRCQLKLYHAKRKPYVNMVQKCSRVLWAKTHLNWTVSKWKSVLWSDESKSDILVENNGRHVLRAKEERDLPACHQRSVQKPASLMVWGPS